jgi:hypothetical protein
MPPHQSTAEPPCNFPLVQLLVIPQSSYVGYLLLGLLSLVASLCYSSTSIFFWCLWSVRALPGVAIKSNAGCYIVPVIPPGLNSPGWSWMAVHGTRMCLGKVLPLASKVIVVSGDLWLACPPPLLVPIPLGGPSCGGRRTIGRRSYEGWCGAQWPCDHLATTLFDRSVNRCSIWGLRSVSILPSCCPPFSLMFLLHCACNSRCNSIVLSC